MVSTNDIEKQLRDAIASSGQSLNQLGEAANVNDGQLSRFVRGERTLTLETVARLCRVLGLKFCPDQTASPDKPRPRKPASPVVDVFGGADDVVDVFGGADEKPAAKDKPAAKRKGRSKK